MSEATKTVKGYFGDIQLTREAFCKRWVDTVSDLTHLADWNNSEECQRVADTKDWVYSMAGRKWDNM